MYPRQMSTTPKILAFAGSLRRDSWNKKVVKIAADAARSSGADVTYLDLAELPMPPYDGDLEQAEGLPDNAARLRELLLAHDGLLIASPENNSSISGTLKNAIDWATRTKEKKGSTDAFQGKVAGLLAASTGALGGVRGLLAVRSILGNIGVLVLPEQATIPKAQDAFGPDGKLKDERQQASVEKVGKRLAQVVGALASR